jgi:hypothetical protein
VGSQRTVHQRVAQRLPRGLVANRHRGRHGRAPYCHNTARWNDAPYSRLDLGGGPSVAPHRARRLHESE